MVVMIMCGDTCSVRDPGIAGDAGDAGVAGVAGDVRAVDAVVVVMLVVVRSNAGSWNEFCSVGDALHVFVYCLFKTKKSKNKKPQKTKTTNQNKNKQTKSVFVAEILIQCERSCPRPPSYDLCACGASQTACLFHVMPSSNKRRHTYFFLIYNFPYSYIFIYLYLYINTCFWLSKAKTEQTHTHTPKQRNMNKQHKTATHNIKQQRAHTH